MSRTIITEQDISDAKASSSSLSPVGEKIQELEEISNDTDYMIRELYDRLSSVLSPVVEKSTDPSQVNIDECDLEIKLNQLIEEGHIQLDNLDRLIRRIRL